MRRCLLLKGIVAPEISQDSCHCELGYGQGVSANIHAAATPGKYFGTDFNPAHAAQANELLKASGADAKFLGTGVLCSSARAVVDLLQAQSRRRKKFGRADKFRAEII